ncbi:hypothetical protein ABZ401_17605, partial [Streptomyces sp. NPDC005892]
VVVNEDRTEATLTLPHAVLAPRTPAPPRPGPAVPHPARDVPAKSPPTPLPRAAQPLETRTTPVMVPW